ncbi:MAG: carboxypeptidase-like regulatory domain-containing protein [Bacteroidales bacterium]|nr:carboxypeptidase-like regulatory domain-containing protein [Bacteroidales bacterium]
MSDNNKYRNSDIKKLIDYLRNLLSGKERNAFERDLEKNPFEADAMEGFQSISPEELESDLRELDKNIKHRLKRSNRMIVYKIAAGIAVILSLSISYFMIFDRQIEELPGNFNVSENIQDKGVKEKEAARTIDAEKNEAETAREESVKQDVLAKEEEIPAEISYDEVIIEEPVLSETKQVNVSVEEDVLTYEFAVEDNLNKELIVAESISEAIPVLALEEVSVDKKVLAAPIEAAYSKSSSKSRSSRRSASTPQTQTLSGVVSSAEDAEPLAGASVAVKGKVIGVVTDMEGKFELSLDNEDSILVASFIGMESQEFVVEDDRNLNISLEPSALSLEEVVVVGYGSGTDNEDLANTDYQAASPVNGIRNYKQYIKENIIFPKGFTKSNKEVVILKFTVSKLGKTERIRIIRSASDDFSNEAIRILEEGPLWNPTMRYGNYSEEETRLRILFEK